MDTLVIVRRIREAETLADQGSHGEAMRLLEPLLAEVALQDAHRTLIRRKLELFEKQRARVTRIMTRSGSSSSSLSAVTGVRKAVNPNETSELTAIRKPVDPASERPTDVPLDKSPPGVPTEAVPKVASKPSPVSGVLRRPGVQAPPGHDTDYGQRESTEVPTRAPVAPAPTVAAPAPPAPVAATPPAPARSPDSTVLMPGPARPLRPDPNDSQELAPLADEPIADEHGDDDPRSTSIFAIPPAPVVVVDQVVQPRPESAPVLARVGTPQEDTKTPPPAPRKAVSEHAIPAPPVPPVRDSIVMPHVQNAIPTPVPGPSGLTRGDDSTLLLADEHFARSAPRKGPQSTPDLRALVDRLPDDDLRRELALEVVRLREELEKSRRETAVQDSPSRRIERVKPESGTFHIPASQANTIVRRAAGSDRIEVHMPSRDEDAAELQVLRRDSVRGKRADTNPADRVALAQDYIDASQAARPGWLRPLGTWLLAAAALVFAAWLVHLVYRSVTSAEPVAPALTETGVGGIELGMTTDAPALAGAVRDVNRQVYEFKDRPWLVQYATRDGRERVVAVTVPLGGADPGLSHVQFGAATLRLAEGTGLDHVMAQLGSPDPPFSEAMFAAQPEYSLQFRDNQGRSVLELLYRGGRRDAAVALRLVDASVNVPFPDLAGR
jgi:hypothetical protein